MTQLVCIINGKAEDNPALHDALARVEAAGHDIVVNWTRRADDAERFVSDLAKSGDLPDTLIAGGGDGTLNAVFGAVHSESIGERLSLAVLPLGTANDLARTLGVPLNDFDAAFDLALTGDARPLDIGLLNTKPFANLVSVGFGAQVTAETDPRLKKLLGGFAYLVSAAARLGEAEPYRAKVRAEDFEWAGAFVAFAVGNGRQAGGGVPVCPDAKIDDGLLDLAILPHLLSEDGEDTGPGTSPPNLLVRRQNAWFEIESEVPLPFNLDGEPDRQSKMRIEVVPNALRVRMPPTP